MSSRVDRRAGDRLLLSSDGLHGQVDDEAIAAVLRDETDPGAAADRLVGLANAAGGDDNVTVIVIDLDALAARGRCRVATRRRPLPHPGAAGRDGRPCFSWCSCWSSRIVAFADRGVALVRVDRRRLRTAAPSHPPEAVRSSARTSGSIQPVAAIRSSRFAISIHSVSASSHSGVQPAGAGRGVPIRVAPRAAMRIALTVSSVRPGAHPSDVRRPAQLDRHVFVDRGQVVDARALHEEAGDRPKACQLRDRARHGRRHAGRSSGRCGRHSRRPHERRAAPRTAGHAGRRRRHRPRPAPRRSRSGSGPGVARYASSIASTTSGPVRMLPWAATPAAVRPPAQARHASPVCVAAPPAASTIPAWRVPRSGSAATRRARASAAPIPDARSARPSGPYATLADACVATAPTPARALGTTEPTAEELRRHRDARGRRSPRRGPRSRTSSLRSAAHADRAAGPRRP